MSQVRVSENTHELLRSISVAEGRPMQDIIDRALDDYRRKAFLKGLSEDYKRFRSDAAGWAEHRDDISEWDTVLHDGLEKE